MPPLNHPGDAEPLQESSATPRMAWTAWLELAIVLVVVLTWYQQRGIARLWQGLQVRDQALLAVVGVTVGTAVGCVVRVSPVARAGLFAASVCMLLVLIHGWGGGGDETWGLAAIFAGLLVGTFAGGFMSVPDVE